MDTMKTIARPYAKAAFDLASNKINGRTVAGDA